MTKQWLTFDEVMERLGAAEFEIIELFKNGMTPFNTETGDPLPYYSHTEKGTPKLLQKHEVPSEYLKTWNTFVGGQRWANILTLYRATGNDYLIHIFRDSGCIRWSLKDVETCQETKAPAKRQSTKDKEELQAWVKSLGKNPGAQIDLAREAHKKPQFKAYTEETLKKWIKDVHPSHTPGKPGRKKSQNK